ncbi:pilus assembly FimT family protein [Nostoc sp. CMAA1605]|uniref:pilus assembly FimT family protein n=1 Tax=Nostoc sp. CMAA1605 TaxID=2055159 RepID=UPI001F2AA4C7|nr:type II secretion system protein [Nostoc sp. CMAA1605]
MNKYSVHFCLYGYKKVCNRKDYSGGFTLIEILVAVVVLGIITTLSLLRWQVFIETRNLNDAQEKLYWAMRQAQSQAVKEKITTQVSLREYKGVVQWAIHSADPDEFLADDIANNTSLWNNFHQNVQIYQEDNERGKKETTFPKKSAQQVWRVLFNYQGCPVYNTDDECTKTSLRTLGQLTFYSQKVVKVKRCVYVSTILGAIRTGKENSRANTNGKYCY